MQSPSRSTPDTELKEILKEWAVAVEALERGETALVVRKGGIREKSFAVPAKRFLLFSGYEHQKPELLKPESRHLLEDMPQRKDDEGPVRFTSFAEVHGAYEISSKESLDAIDPYHIWTPEYAESRFKWRPKKPLTALVLRTYLMPEAVEFPYTEAFGGCKSWLELDEPVDISGSVPALSETEFERLTAPALETLERLEPAPVGPAGS
ncbi:DUF1802 family protein [Rubrobacter aplysinae]|uniref:DUF1802 family protein n=1 Tax=Rubrobacter aplysinae TaxID=909625 RepID=UPI001364B72D|nr:DUF1802 family protein [Rubrobacter aplysinae]